MNYRSVLNSKQQTTGQTRNDNAAFVSLQPKLTQKPKPSSAYNQAESGSNSARTHQYLKTSSENVRKDDSRPTTAKDVYNRAKHQTSHSQSLLKSPSIQKKFVPATSPVKYINQIFYDNSTRNNGNQKRQQFLTNEACFTNNKTSYNFQKRVVNEKMEQELARFKVEVEKKFQASEFRDFKMVRFEPEVR